MACRNFILPDFCKPCLFFLRNLLYLIHEEKQLYTVDRYFVNEDEDAFCAGGLKITAKLLAEAMRSLPEEKRQAVLLYYFFSMTDTEIAELMKVPRSTVQYRRTSSFELLKRYLEERADEWDEL